MGSLRTSVWRRFWNAHSRGWDTMRSEAGTLAQIGEVADTLRACSRAGGSVVDLGCGSGQHAVALAERGLEVTAIDYSPAMLELARGHARESNCEIDFVEADLDGDLPLAAASFDAALCVSVLQVLTDADRFLQQVRDSLRPGGRLLVESVRELGALSHGDDLGTRDKTINMLKVTVARLLPHTVHEYTPDDITSLVEHAGMRVDQIDTYDATFAVLARRPTS